MGIEPFHWQLKTVSAASVSAMEALFSFLPATTVRDTIALELRKVLMHHLGNDSYFTLESVDVTPCRQWTTALSEPTIVAVLGMVPFPTKVLVHVDHIIAHHVIDRLLGGGGDITPEIRLLTEAEIGVLQYLFMQLLSKLHTLCAHDERVHFRFEQILQRTENLLQFSPVKEEGVVMSFRLGFAEHVGFVRFLFPNPLITGAMVEPLHTTTSTGERHYWKSRMEAFGDQKASVWAEAGVVTIHPDELKGLEVGDVILLDESDIRMTGKKLDGDLKLRIGDGQHGYVQARVDTDHDVIHCVITDIEAGG